jgi:DNA mismatch repair protein MutL
MANTITRLPDAIANQIAAGEVVQRPASAVKELLENAIDAGASQIHLIIENAGVGMIQVIDNGVGMSVVDARMSLERHATSKIKEADDLFHLQSYGFRGEALASIVAIAQVEIKTKRESDELGTHLVAEASKVISQDFCQTPVGSVITIRNLFFNVPARRNFLKSTAVETKHITEEFVRVALVNPDVSMKFTNNTTVVHDLDACELEERIGQLFQLKPNEDLIPIEEETDVVSIKGFIGVPEIAKRTRGMQYFFANERFIRDPYLQHAVFGCYDEIIEKDRFPSFFIHLQVESEKIDVNIHPTKTEVKFEDSRFIYTILQSVVKRAIGNRYLSMPEAKQDWMKGAQPHSFPSTPSVKVNQRFNPFPSESRPKVPSKWETLYEPFRDQQTEQTATPSVRTEPTGLPIHSDVNVFSVQQLFNRFIIAETARGSFLIDQHAAHVRILYEEFMSKDAGKAASQQLLFPVKMAISPEHHTLLSHHLDFITDLGFGIHLVDNASLMINSVPASLAKKDPGKLMEECLMSLDLQQHPDVRSEVALSLARSASIARHEPLNDERMNYLVEQLLKCEETAYAPDGQLILVPWEESALERLFT